MNSCIEFLEENAIALNAKKALIPAEKLVVTGCKGITPLGSIEETFDAMLEGRSGAVYYPLNNFRTNIAAPVKFNPQDHFSEKELRGKDDVMAMSIHYHREVTKEAKLYEPDGKTLLNSINKNEIGICTSTAIGSAPNITRIFRAVFENTYGIRNETLLNEMIRWNTSRIRPSWLQEIFPHEVNSGPGIDIGVSGSGVNSFEACATGLSSVVLLCILLKSGYLQGGYGGGFENLLHNSNGTAVNLTTVSGFASMRSALAEDFAEPEKISRPFDRDRDGFLMAAGGATIFIENYLHAILRDAQILAEIGGFSKSTDGYSPTDLDIDNVARTIIESLVDPWTGEIQKPDLILAHATSTKPGDRAEGKALFKVFGKYLKDIPIGAIKGNIGHLLGGAGAVNLAIAIECMRRGIVPPILNLDNPRLNVDDLNVDDDPIIKFMDFVRYHPLKKVINSVLVLAYGFGGFNAAVLLRKFQPTNQLV